MDRQADIHIADAVWHLNGHWTIANLSELVKRQPKLSRQKQKEVTLDGAALESLDSAGALLVNQFISMLENHEVTVLKINFKESHLSLLDLAQQPPEDTQNKGNDRSRFPFIHWLGKKSVSLAKQADGYMVLFGQVSHAFFKALLKPSLFEVKSIARGVEVMGFQALTIVGLLSFLIGVVLAYQMGIQLETYGASIYIAYICGLAILREFGPLIAAIIVAGRTSSSITAQIGSMKVGEEIDAIKTMGLSPTQLLVLPKILSLLIAFPLLVFCADIFGVLGSMLMAKIQLGITFVDFLRHFKEGVGILQFMLGILKAPFFALIIAMVGCYQGFQVVASANSVGSKTTTSVVQAIFLIIVADAIFSIVFTWLGV